MLRRPLTIKFALISGACLLSITGFAVGRVSVQNERNDPYLQYWTSVKSIDDDSSERIWGYGSHVITIKDGVLLLRLYYVNDGGQKLVGEILADPEIKPFIATTPAIRGDKGIVELGGPIVDRRSTTLRTTSEHIQVDFPLPHSFGCSQGGGTNSNIESEEVILNYWIQEKGNAPLPETAFNTIDSMIEASRKDNVAFVYVTAEPIAAQ